MKIRRKIVTIDEEKCNGCGACAISCAEGALQIINGKAKLLSEKYCDGLGACLGECPQDAITVEERESEVFDEAAVKHYMENKSSSSPLLGGCPSSTVRQFTPAKQHVVSSQTMPSALTQWPVQLTLVPPGAPFLENADLMLIADCVPFAYPDLHSDFIKDHAILVACPKLDDFAAHLEKLTQILTHSSIKSITVVHMEVPCCSGLTYMTRQAINRSDKDIPLQEITISINGDRK